MILLIDNYDSFSYNVYQLIGSVEPDIKVVRNDEYTVEEIEAMKPEALILSPGPGKPSDAGICIEAIKYFAWKTSNTSASVLDIRQSVNLRRQSFLRKRTDARQEKNNLYRRRKQTF